MSEKKCTWEGCKNVAKNPLVSKDGRIWADLCSHHKTAVDLALLSGEPKAILRSWIMAQGGSKKAAKAMEIL